MSRNTNRYFSLSHLQKKKLTLKTFLHRQKVNQAFSFHILKLLIFIQSEQSLSNTEGKCAGGGHAVQNSAQSYFMKTSMLAPKRKKASIGCCNSLNGRTATLLKILVIYSLSLFYPHVLRQVDFIKEVSKLRSHRQQ